MERHWAHHGVACAVDLESRAPGAFHAAKGAAARVREAEAPCRAPWVVRGAAASAGGDEKKTRAGPRRVRPGRKVIEKLA